MFTQPKIFTPKIKSERAYIIYYFDGKHQREYNGKRLNLNLNPNHCTKAKDKKEQLLTLQFEVTKALNNGWNPLKVKDEIENISLKEALTIVLNEKLSSNLCDHYKRNLKGVYDMFIGFVPSKILNDASENLTLSIIEKFLNRFKLASVITSIAEDVCIRYLMSWLGKVF